MDEQLKREQLEREFEQIRELSEDGKLYPEKAVAWARQQKDSVLHGELEWDDTRAAEAHRADQVRALIRVVIVQSAETGRHVRAYISHPTDRIYGGGYTRVSESLARARQELVNEALVRFRRLRAQFTHLPELDPLFAAIEREVDVFAETRVKRAG